MLQGSGQAALPAVQDFVQVCPQIKGLSSPSLAPPSSLAAVVLHGGFAVQKPPEPNGCYPGGRERETFVWLADVISA